MKYRAYMAIWVLAGLFTACADKEALPEADEAQMMRVSLETKGLSPATHANPVLLFWEKTQYDALNLADPHAAPTVTAGATMGSDPSYQATTPSSNLEYYSDVKYSLGEPYHATETYYASGYWPSTIVPEVASDYSRLTIPTSVRTANTDILVADGIIQGSKAAPFSTPLNFMHACVKLTFQAVRAATMTNRVDNVYVRALEMPATLRWDFTRGRYVADWQTAYEATDIPLHTDDFPQVGPNVAIGTHDKSQLVKYGESGWAWRDIDGELYVAPGTGATEGLSQVTLRITYDTSLNSDMSSPTHNVAVVTVPIVDSYSNSTSLVAGDAYLIQLTFDDVAIHLSAVKVDWITGSSVVVPIMLEED